MISEIWMVGVVIGACLALSVILTMFHEWRDRPLKEFRIKKNELYLKTLINKCLDDSQNIKKENIRSS